MYKISFNVNKNNLKFSLKKKCIKATTLISANEKDYRRHSHYDENTL